MHITRIEFKKYWLKGKVFAIQTLVESYYTAKCYYRVHTDIFNNQTLEQIGYIFNDGRINSTKG